MKRCSFTMKSGQVPGGSRIITSDDVFDYLLEIRALNQGIDLRRGQLLPGRQIQRLPLPVFGGP